MKCLKCSCHTFFYPNRICVIEFILIALLKTTTFYALWQLILPSLFIFITHLKYRLLVSHCCFYDGGFSLTTAASIHTLKTAVYEVHSSLVCVCVFQYRTFCLIMIWMLFQSVHSDRSTVQHSWYNLVKFTSTKCYHILEHLVHLVPTVSQKAQKRNLKSLHWEKMASRVHDCLAAGPLTPPAGVRPQGTGCYYRWDILCGPTSLALDYTSVPHWDAQQGG